VHVNGKTNPTLKKIRTSENICSGVKVHKKYNEKSETILKQLTDKSLTITHYIEELKEELSK
jgi:hypothetical protein